MCKYYRWLEGAATHTYKVEEVADGVVTVRYNGSVIAYCCTMREGMAVAARDVRIHRNRNWVWHLFNR